MKFAFLLVATITGLVLEITTSNAQSIYSSQPNGTGNGGMNYYDSRAYDNEVRDAGRALGR